MRIAIAIIGIMLGLVVLLQSCTISAGSSLLGDQAMGNAGGIGMIAGFLLFVGGAFSFGLPLVGTIVFAVAAVLALMGTERFPDLQVWAVASAILAGMGLIGWRTDRKKKQRAPAAVGVIEQRE
jgi:hypothetical protein